MDILPVAVKRVSGRVKRAIFLGESSGLLAEAFGDRIPWKKAKDLVDAVSLAFDQAKEGDVVLLAPACSSFDMFESYGQRGTVFREAVRRLRNGV